MNNNRLINIIIIFILVVCNIGFAYFYNASVTEAVTQAAYNDYEILQNYTTEIIEKLCSRKSTSDWNEVIEGYQDIIIVIEDSSNNVVAKSEDKDGSALDVKVQTPFDFNGEAYLIRTSVYLLRDYVADSRAMIKFIFMELLIGIMAVFIFIMIIYSIMLRPYRVIYKAIEEYDKTGKLSDVKLKGYAGTFYKRFVLMAKNLENQQQNQRRIIASISHDIKTPLTSIMGYSERLKKDNISEERKERYLDTVYEKAVDIQTLVGEFDEYLGYNLPYEMKVEKMPVADLEKYFIEDFSADLEFSGIGFQVNNMTDSNAAILGDIQKLKRVCGNILGNSVKHFGDNDKFIRIDIMSEADKIIFRFSDSGHGVPEDKLEIIFEPLYTSDEGRKVAGLGLSICREIVEAHKGKIYAEKSDMGGLTVCVELPRG